VAAILNAQTALTIGAAASTQDAVTAANGTTTTTSAVGTVAVGFLMGHDTMANAGEQDSDDSTTFSNALVVPSADGKTATVFGRATNNATLTDTSTGTAITVPTHQIEDVAYFMTTGTTPSVTANADMDALVSPLTVGAVDTATDPSDDVTPDTSNAFTTDTNTGLLAPPASSTTSPPISPMAGSLGSYHSANLSGVRNWAHQNFSSSNTNGYSSGEDCTDFVSRALAYGGGLRPQWNGFSDGFIHNNSDINKWYHVNSFAYSRTWGAAYYNYQWQHNQGSPTWTSIAAGVRAGDIIYTNFGSGNIYHAGIVDQVIGSNLIIDQHSGAHQDALYGTGLRSSHWFGSASTAKNHYWIFSPGDRY
jgi:hypothetical protein